MAADKDKFYETAAKGIAASTILYKVDAIVHVEDKDDIWFWQHILSKYSNRKYKFRYATINEYGNLTTGCRQCLKYRNFLSKRFFICIDSDFRYLNGENISAMDYILQTYTYSWENHCVFANKLQSSFEKYGPGNINFDFNVFLANYSLIAYKPFLLMLHQDRNDLGEFDREIFKQCISLQYKQGDELNNGTQLLKRLSSNLNTAIANIKKPINFDFDKESKEISLSGVKHDNVYLYVRGHCLYNSILSIGNKLCESSKINFEHNILKSDLAFGQYPEINKIQKDVEAIESEKSPV